MAGTALIPAGTTRLLLIEGKSEQEFFIRLSAHLGFDKPPFWIICYEGIDQFSGVLKNIINSPNYPAVTHIGITRDADFTGGAFQSVCHHLKALALTVPDAPMAFVGNQPQIGIYVMPDNRSVGMLETLLWHVLRDDPIAHCVDAYFECLQVAGISPKIEPMPKAQLLVYMQGLLQTLIVGKNVDENALAKDRNKHYLTDIYKMSWWSWDKPEFDAVKTFIRQLSA